MRNERSCDSARLARLLGDASGAHVLFAAWASPASAFPVLSDGEVRSNLFYENAKEDAENHADPAPALTGTSGLAVTARRRGARPGMSPGSGGGGGGGGRVCAASGAEFRWRVACACPGAPRPVPRPRYLMIVAHPDDETFLGYAALRYGLDWHRHLAKNTSASAAHRPAGLAPLNCGSWKVVCITNASPNSSYPPGMCSQARHTEFEVAMRALGAYGEMWDFADDTQQGAEPMPELASVLSETLREREWEAVVRATC